MLCALRSFEVSKHVYTYILHTASSSNLIVFVTCVLKKTNVLDGQC